MSAQPGGAVLLVYGPQGAQQVGGSVLLSYTPPAAPSRAVVSETRMRWGKGTHRSAETRSPMPASRSEHVEPRSRWGKGASVQHTGRSRWAVSALRDREAATPWGKYASHLARAGRVGWIVSLPLDVGAATPWGQYLQRLALGVSPTWPTAHPADPGIAAPWGRYLGRMARALDAQWVLAATADAPRLMPWGRYTRNTDQSWVVVVPPGDPDEPLPALIVIPVRSLYVAQNNVSLHRMPSGAEFVASRFSLQLDADSFTFGWSASLHSSARQHLTRSTPGERVEVECAVNGVLLRLVIESIGRDRQFPDHRITVQGRGRSAELADPSLTFTNPADRTAQQLMLDVLTVNGASLGWTLDWQISDWFVPADRWVFQGSYMGALQDIASAAGAYIQPHRTDKVIRVLPRYALAPWDWATLMTPDIELPVEATSLEGVEEVIRPDWNRVFVGGVHQPGYFGPVTRAGTAGDKVAQPIIHPLITAPEAHIQRGRAELSDTGVQELLSLRTMVLPEAGIILPGKSIRYVDETGARLGIVRGTNVSMDRWPVLHQTLEVETHVQ